MGDDLLGRGVAARAEGGLIEASEALGDRWALAPAVRWHPELLDGTSSERLFHAFDSATQRKV